MNPTLLTSQTMAKMPKTTPTKKMSLILKGNGLMPKMSNTLYSWTITRTSSYPKRKGSNSNFSIGLSKFSNFSRIILDQGHPNNAEATSKNSSGNTKLSPRFDHICGTNMERSPMIISSTPIPSMRRINTYTSKPTYSLNNPSKPPTRM